MAHCIISHKVNGFVASHSFEYHSITISSSFSTAIFRIENCWYEGEKTSSYGQLQPKSQISGIFHFIGITFSRPFGKINKMKQFLMVIGTNACV